MRIYVPATLDELDGVDAGSSATLWGITPREVNGVTKRLVAELAAGGPGGPEEQEELEYEAFLDAATAAAGLLAARPDAPPLRAVVTVEVPDDALAGRDGLAGPSGAAGGAAPASALRLVRAVERVPIVCVHADEPDAAPDVEAVRAAVEADDDDALADAVLRLEERDLLWYDWSEVTAIPR
ncbi:DUF6912 family protein [Myceligenerans crystallogenes]|uniref:Uncharacterized protein n=1 Tax=Myceligenerans crystallogenes TaxID=316335 RepID=A0ABN2N4I5_9MICO